MTYPSSISKRSNNKTYKSTYDILHDISEVWDELTDKQRAGLTEKLFGKNRANIGVAIISNFAQAEAAMQKMADSAGDADAEMGIITESISYKLNALKETGTGIFQNLFARDDVKVAIDGLTSLLEIVEKVTDVLGLFGTAAVAGGAFFGISKIMSAFKELKALNQVTSLVNVLSTAFPRMANSIAGVQAAFSAFTSTMASTGSVSAALGASFTYLSATIIPVVAGIAAAGVALYGLYKYTHQAEDANKRLENSFQQYKDSGQELTDLNSKLEETRSKIDDLRGKGTLTIYEQSELGKLERVSAELEKQIGLQEKLNEKDAKQAAKDAQDAFEKNFGKKGLDQGLIDDTNNLFSTGAYDYVDAITSGNIMRELAGVQEAKRAADEWYNSTAEDAQANWEQANNYIDQGTDKIWGQVEMLQGYLDVFNELPESTRANYQGTIDQIQGTIDTVWQTLDPDKWREMKFTELYNADDIKEAKENLKDLAKQQGELSVDDIERNYSDLAQKIKSAGFDVQDFVNVINQEVNGDGVEGVTDGVEQLAETTESTTEKFVKFQAAVSTALSESQSATGLTTESVDALKNAYAGLEGFDPARLFENTANGIHLNEEYFKELNEQVANNQIRTAMQDIFDLQQQINEAKQAGEDTSGLESELQQAQQLKAQYDGILSSYNAWKSAMSGGNERDSYESIGSSYKDMKEILDKGWFGDESVDTYLDMMLGAENRTNDIVADFERLNQTIEGTSHSLMDYWQYDSDKNLVSDGLFNFLDDVKTKLGDDFVSLDEEGNYAFDFTGEKLQQVADAFGISTEMVQLFERALIDAGMAVQLGDAPIADQISSAKEAVQALQESGDISGGIDLNFDVESAPLDDVKSKIDELKSERINIDAEENPEAASALDNLISKLEQEYNLRLNLETNGGLDKAAVWIDQINELISSNSNSVLTVDAVVNGSEQISAIVGEIAQLPPEVQTTIGIQAENVGSVEGILNQLASSPESITVPVNYTAGQSPQAVEDAQGVANYILGDYPKLLPDATGKANFTLGTYPQTVPGVWGTANFTLGSYPTSMPSITQTVRRTYVDQKYTGTMQSIGRAHASGSAYNVTNYRSAYADGKVALDRDEIALVNELGQESIIRDGHWLLLPPGMHEQSLKKGDIVLSAGQTHALLTSGVAPGTGRALASGTLLNAYDSGSGGKRRKSSSSTTSASSSSSKKSKSRSKSSSKSSSSSKSKDSNSSSDSDGTEFDWIEIKIEKIERKIKRFKTVVDNTFESFSKRTKSLNKEIGKTVKEIGIQEKAADAYLKEANSLGLSKKWRNRVKNGKYDISEIEDKDLAQKVKKYQELYKKYQDCKTAVNELTNSLGELTKERFELTITKWDNAVQNLAHSVEHVESLISRRNSFANEYRAATFGLEASQKNITSYNDLLDNALKQQDIRRKELADLNSQLASALKDPNSGIKEGSEGYYEILADIQDVEKEIDELGEKVIDYSNEISKEYVNMFDAIGDRYENVLLLAQHKANEFNNALEIAEARGFVTSARYYTELAKIESENIKQAEKEAKELQDALTNAIANDAVQIGSEKYYEMTKAIYDANEAIQEGTKSLIEYNNQIRQISWDRFDMVREQVDYLTDESDFLIDLMSNSDLFDADGNITDEGRATFGLHGLNYNTEMNQADEYAEEIKRINREIANDPANTTLIERRQKLLEQQRDSIKAAEREKQAIKSLVEDGIKSQLDAMKELIDNYKDALDNQKDLYDYQKKVGEQTKKISNLQKQLSAYSGDNSEENRARLQKLRTELADAQEDLQETEYDRYISDQKKLLDDLYDDYEKTMNERLDNIDTLIADVINQINIDSKSIGATLSTVAENVGLDLSTEMKTIWQDGGDGKKAIDLYGAGFLTEQTTLNTAVSGIKTTVDNLYTLASSQASTDVAKVTQEESAKNTAETKAAGTAAKTSTPTGSAQKQTDLGTTAKTTATTTKTTTTQKTTTPAKTNTNTKKATTTKKTAKWGSWFVKEKYSGSKKGLDTDISIVDRLLAHNINADFKKRKVYYGKMGGSGGSSKYTGTAKQNTWMIAQMKKHGYASGAKRVGVNGLAWTNEYMPETIVRKSDHAVLTRVSADDRIYNAMASENLWRAANNPSGYVMNSLAKVGTASGMNMSGFGSTVNVGGMQINLEGIKDWSSFMYAAQHSKDFEKLVQAMTVDRLAGRSKNAKYNI